jgi:hypothetical protein
MKGKGLLTKHVQLVMSQEDYLRLQARFGASTSPAFSAFLRDILQSRPVVVRYHNDAADEFLMIALELKRELEEVIGELRPALQSSGSFTEEQLTGLSSKVEELKLIMHQIYQKWSSS